MSAGNFGIAEQQLAIDDVVEGLASVIPKLTDFGVSSERHVRFFDCLAHFGAGERVQLAAAAFLQPRAGSLQFLECKSRDGT